MGNLIGVHGLDNKPSPQRLEEAWKKALSEGFSRQTGSDHDFKLHICYWADLFYASPIETEHEPYTPSRGPITPGENPGPYRSEQLLELSPEEMGLRYPDLLRYYRESALGRSTRRRLRGLLQNLEGHPLMLMAHSMGCLIAYDVLVELASADLAVEMVTFGCPLGLPQLWKRMKGDHRELQVPRVVHSWTNYLDPRDPVATPGLAEIFAAGPNRIQIRDCLIQNDYRSPAGDSNPHKVYGYLRSAAFSEQAAGFLKRVRKGEESAVKSHRSRDC